MYVIYVNEEETFVRLDSTEPVMEFVCENRRLLVSKAPFSAEVKYYYWTPLIQGRIEKKTVKSRQFKGLM